MPWFQLFLCAVLHAPVLSQTDATYQLTPGIPETVPIPTTGVVNFEATDVSATSRFLVMQVHAQHASLILRDTSSASGDSITGNSMGMVRKVNGSADGARWSVAVSAGAAENVTTMVTLQEYGANAPVPGGCNQVFALEVDPNIRLTTADHRSQVWFQWASEGGRPASCEDAALTSRLNYDVYVKYVSSNDDSVEGLLGVVQDMMTADKIQSQAQKILSVKNDGTQKSLTTVTSQRAQGAVYGVVVTDDKRGLTAAYVPAITYGCNYTAGECSLEYGATEWVMIVASGVVGLFLLILGHAFLKTELALFGFISTTLVSFILLTMAGTVADGACLAIAAAIGLVGAGLWLFVWWMFSFPSVSVLLPGLCAGFLVSGVLFFTPFANISWWASDVNYGLVFACIALFFAVLLLFSPRTLNIVSCSLVGGYCVVMVAGILLRSSLRMIVLNVVHHASVAGYATVLVITPFQAQDIILGCAWALLLVLGICWQFYRSKGEPHFPNQRQQRSHPVGNRPHVRDGTIPPLPVVDERSPLLGNQTPPPLYQEAVRNNGQRQRPSEMNPPM
ncbi:hypothetical protein V1264_003236 [Littorina saxatilis]